MVSKASVISTCTFSTEHYRKGPLKHLVDQIFAVLNSLIVVILSTQYVYVLCGKAIPDLMPIILANPITTVRPPLPTKEYIHARIHFRKKAFLNGMRDLRNQENGDTFQA